MTYGLSYRSSSHSQSSYSGNNNDNDDIKCYKCGGRHYSSECKTQCHNCGGPHHSTHCTKKMKKKKRSFYPSNNNNGTSEKRLKQDNDSCSPAIKVAEHADVFAMFGVKDDTNNDVVMGQSTQKTEGRAINTQQQVVLSQSSTVSQTSQMSCGRLSSELTPGQRERIQRNKETAQKRKMARLNHENRLNVTSMDINMNQQSDYRNGGNQMLSQESNMTTATSCTAMSQSPKRKKGGTVINPYLQTSSPNIKRDERKPNDAFFLSQPTHHGPVKTLDDLPPIPDDAPPIRPDTLKILSEQQLKVIMAVRPPLSMVANNGNLGENLFPQTQHQHYMIRVNAAAGTGKTTTLMHLATRCIDVGHRSITYVTYSRASAQDAQGRMQAALDTEHKNCVHASTLHSCAMRLLNNIPLDQGEDDNKRVLDDHQFQNFLKDHWGGDIEDYLQPAIQHVRSTTNGDDMHKLDGKKKLLFEKVLYYLTKTFKNFTIKAMSLDELKNKQNSKRHYFPITSTAPQGQFKEGGAAAKLGFPPGIYSNPSSYTFFADLCVEVWDYVVKHRIKTFDIVMKRAQLNKLRIPSSVLLVDECQDLDECQVDWAEKQKQYGTHIFFVGDSAQCIYGFRGAKSKHVMKLDCIDTQLTTSWRFGPTIAKVANIPLYAKEKSLQTTKLSNVKLWKPYRVEGGREAEGDESGKVTTTSLLENWQKEKKTITLIGRTNARLMQRAMALLGLGSLENPTPIESSEDGNSDHDYGNCTSMKEELESTMIKVEDIPKIHINGGVTSGRSLWKKTTKRIRHLYELFTSRDESGYHIPLNLPISEFKEFVNDNPVTWNSFQELCHTREITTYVFALEIVSIYQQNTLQAIDAFESHVLSKNFQEEDADIILSTMHASKGLEWDHVEVCEDLLDLAETSYIDNLPSKIYRPSFLNCSDADGEWRKGWQFNLSEYQDQGINGLYVALTRAKKTVCVPKSIKLMLEDFDRIHYLVETFKKDTLGVDGSRKSPLSGEESMITVGNKGRKLTKGEVWNLYHDMILPLRNELGVPGDANILESVFSDFVGDELNIKEEGAKGIKTEESACGNVGQSMIKTEHTVGQADNHQLAPGNDMMKDDVASYFNV